MIKISDRQLEYFARRSLTDCIRAALDGHPEHKAALADPSGFRQFCFDLAHAYRLDDESHIRALVALCLDLGDRRTAFFAQPEIAALPHAEHMEGHQRLYLAGAGAHQQGLLGAGT